MNVKIVATLGPASMNYETMKNMAKEGVRIFRLNFSHSNATVFEPIIGIIRRIESELGISLTALGDLCGPKIRIGEVQGSPVQVSREEVLLLGLPGSKPEDDDRVFISLDIPELLSGLKPGMPVNLSDGLLQFTVDEELVPDSLYSMKAINAGILTSNKGISFPGKHHPMPALTDKDIKDLHEGLDIGIDAFAISFVQGPEDVAMLRDEIKKHGTWVPIVAKLERQNAVDRIEEILEIADIIMVARGDLGLECKLTALPVIQKKIIRACRHAQKPAIVATQMLLSMVKNPIPTRAEATDVANAIMDGADCVMLSEETAVGQYPVETVRTMGEIISDTIPYYLERIPTPYEPTREHNVPKYLAYAACLLARNANSPAIVCHTGSGSTARFVSSRRPIEPVFALTPDDKVKRALNFAWGVIPFTIEPVGESHMQRVEDFVENSDAFKKGDPIVLTAGQPSPGNANPGTNNIKLYYK
ncbi:pyruvate kinase [Desulfovibrio inopinatus]|uniref:pyruvate kinase n=1 Tax=Desulfovibrio inopinatus TaxID=102109 RepID=UPI00040558A8|nr:pyruvate kinase [Desulfovibrio inopinatus]